jgi:aquaporin Z
MCDKIVVVVRRYLERRFMPRKANGFMVDFKKYLVEFIGTFFLVFAVLATGNPFAIGLMFMVMVYMGGHISGGFFNPAVTAAIWLKGKIKLVPALWYWFFQILGGVFAAFIMWVITDRVLYLAPAIMINFWQALLVESLGTFILAIVVLATTMSKDLKGNYIYGFAIGMALSAALFTGGAFSGGAFNPAAGFGPIIFDIMHGGNSWIHLPLYFFGPLFGGIIAAYAHDYLDVNGK